MLIVEILVLTSFFTYKKNGVGHTIPIIIAWQLENYGI